MSRFDWSEENNKCFGCGDNRCGLKLDFKENDDWIEARTRLDPVYQGFKKYAHGGIVATLLDEAAAWAIIIQNNSIAPSYNINCKIRKPVPLQEKLLVRGRVKKIRHGIVFSEAELLDKNNNLLAEGSFKSKIMESE